MPFAFSRREEIRIPVAERPVQHRRLRRIDDPLHAVRAALQIAGHRGVAAAGVRGRAVPCKRETARRCRNECEVIVRTLPAAVRPDTVEDGVDEVCEVPGDGAAAVLPAEDRLADRGAADVQPDDVLIIPGARERDRALMGTTDSTPPTASTRRRRSSGRSRPAARASECSRPAVCGDNLYVASVSKSVATATPVVVATGSGTSLWTAHSRKSK